MRLRQLIALVAVAALLGGCAGPIRNWIVSTRVHQGEVALARGNVRDAELAYRLALRVNPKDARARTGLVEASAGLAQKLYARADFDDALATIRDGLAVDPQSVRLAGLKSSIENAKLKREIVISNYPAYHLAGAQIAQAFVALDATNASLRKSLKRFSYTFDADDLTDAIKRGYEMQLDLVKDTNRLIAYRQLVTSGVPAAAAATEATTTTSVLPLP